MEETTQELLNRIAGQLTRIESHLAGVVPPGEVRHAMGEATEHIADVADTTSVQSPQLLEMIQWMHQRMPADELQKQFDEQFFIAKQLISIMQGTRTDIVELRGDFRRLAALLEQTLRLRVEDDERGWSGEERRNIADRRRAS